MRLRVIEQTAREQYVALAGRNLKPELNFPCAALDGDALPFRSRGYLSRGILYDKPVILVESVVVSLVGELERPRARGWSPGRSCRPPR